MKGNTGPAIIISIMLLPLGDLGMAGTTEYKVKIAIYAAPEVKSMSHSELQTHIPSGFTGTLMEWVDPKLQIDGLNFEFGYDTNNNPIELSSVELKLDYKATIFMSEKIPTSSQCYDAVLKHATEHHEIDFKGLIGVSSKAEAILRESTEKMLNEYKNDLIKLKRDEQSAGTALAKEASGKIQDEIFIPILKKSADIDTDANYRPLAELCDQYK